MIEVNYTLGVQLLNFLIMLWFLNAFVFKPILRSVEERERRIKGMENEGKGAAERCETALAEYEAKIKQMKHEASEITAASRKKAQEAAGKIMDEAKGVFKERIDKARADINKDLDAASATLKKEVSGVASLIASRIMGRSV
ncbi:F0F1 ATP synthase subunit B [Candidatus Saganbacteria bacterium]|uniref:ATP synthase subunit b n=1 Tax=Candidatus Saganbacteria bacterium TaxID=2575572 RepID=A0A9D6UMQ9_UNCSA|nr:F0F1 ATP synthase subunit B [Candidatus Saganbacteria bacterium]